MEKILESEGTATIQELCEGFQIGEATYYRWKNKKKKPVEKPEKPRHWKRLSEDEESEVMELMTSERFIDMAPAAIYATLLDDGEYLCSERTMYRYLERNAAVKERRNQRVHPEYKKPELLATRPKQLWSWDITKLKTGRKCEYLHLYVIIDVYSRFVVGWMVAEKECSILAEQFIAETCFKEEIERDQLTIHADRGAAMKSKTVYQLMCDLGITKTHSRPHVSNDNPYSESQFKTMKYHSTFPRKFGCLEDAKSFLRGWFEWYNFKHKHSGIEMMSPHDVHSGKYKAILEKRQMVLNQAFLKMPHRFNKKKPKVQNLSEAVWINKPPEVA